MKKLSFLILIICTSFTLKAQTGYQEITEKRIEYLASKLSFTSEEAQKFWPLFREFHSKREAATSERKDLKNSPEQLSNDEYLKIVNTIIKNNYTYSRYRIIVIITYIVLFIIMIITHHVIHSMWEVQTTKQN